jgi:sugar/nucleoside kinase (ribokinase family)
MGKRIAVVGSTTIDKIVDRKSECYKLGGVTTYSGITYRRHGLKTHIVTNIAKQDLRLSQKLDREKIVVHQGATQNTTRFINQIYAHDRKQRLLSKADTIKSRQISALADQVDWIHLGPLHALDIGPGCMATLRKMALPVFLDVQGYTRRIHHENVTSGISENLVKALTVSQIVKANETEYKAIEDYYKTDICELTTSFSIKEFVVTLGPKGGFVCDFSGNIIRYEAAPVKRIEDPTGAGDVFFAAYIAGRLLLDKPVFEACNYAARLASRQISGSFITTRMLIL